MKLKHFVVALAAFAAVAVVSQPVGGSWRKLANAGSNFTVAGPSIIRFGSRTSGRWTELAVNGSGMCTAAALGITDPSPGSPAQCDYKNGSTTLIDTDGLATSHRFGLEVNQASYLAENVIARKKPGINYPAIVYGPVPTPAYRPPGFTRFTGSGAGQNWEEEGDFRILCNPAEFLYDDPIVHPGEKDSSHLHMFFGNTSVDAFTTVDNLRSRKGAFSTCSGGTVNMTGYWAPAIINRTTRELVAPTKAIIIYYKTITWPYMADNPELKNLPLGLKIVSNDATRTSILPGDDIYMNCNQGDGSAVSGAGSGILFSNMTACPSGSIVWVKINFGQCWNGELDSPNHRDHITYARGFGDPGFISNPGNAIGRGYNCPTTHPYALPKITEIFKLNVNTKSGPPTNWAWSSDAYLAIPGNSLPGGYSAHADWMMGWDTSFSDTFIQNCLREGRNCGSWNDGTGRGGKTFQGNLDN